MGYKMKNLDCKEFIKISEAFEVRPELVAEVTEIYGYYDWMKSIAKENEKQNRKTD